MSTPAPIQEAFARWWHDEGSGMPPKEGEDRETHMRRVAEIAWSNGAYIASIESEDDLARMQAEDGHRNAIGL